jgi:hypothetical protein
MTTDTRKLAGKCRCGAVRYEVLDGFLYAAKVEDLAHHDARRRACAVPAFVSS